MAIEEEFSIEIPDKEADAIHSGMLATKTYRIKILTNNSGTSSYIYYCSARCSLDSCVISIELGDH